MKFYSLNHNSPEVNFKQALISGLAPDGGLYFPKIIPKFTAGEIAELKDNSLTQVGFKVLSKWLENEFEPEAVKQLAGSALNFPIPLKKVGNFFVLELFHGPTMAFKDIAARSLARLMSLAIEKENQTAIIIVATSGDTGGAVAHGFGNVKNINVVVMYPKGKVSHLQEEQLTRVAPNVFPVEVDGVFDDCQALAKKTFLDPDFKKLNLSSANSISVGRLIPQIIYYVYAYSLIKEPNIEFVVPCGNFGNVCAGIMARAMGLPFNKFIIVNNLNDPVLKYYQTGKFIPQPTVQTLSNAMDIGNPSNFVRILEIFKHDYASFKKVIQVLRVTDEETVATIKEVYEKYNYLLDPHTAVAWHGALGAELDQSLKVILSTASPVKFASIIKKETGIAVDDSQAIKELEKITKRKLEIKNDYNELKKTLLSLPL